MEINKEEIRVLELLESESNAETETSKFNRVDLKCKDAQGKIIIIEIQNQREFDYLQRMLWGTSKAVVECVTLGNKYSDVAKVISVNILYHKLRMDEKENTDFIYRGVTELVGIHTNKPLVLHGTTPGVDKISAVMGRDIFPEYYMIYAEKFQDVINDDIDEWVYFFKHGAIRDDFKSPGILLAAKKLDGLSMNPDERRVYENYLDYLRREWSQIETAKMEGREEGLEKGREEGRSIAMIEIAKQMLRDNESYEKIERFTKLTLEEIKELG